MTDALPALDQGDRQEISDLVTEHAWLLDHGRWHDTAELFLADASVSLGPRTLNGRAALLAWADDRAANAGRRTHHQCTNIRTVADSDDEASGWVMLVLHVSDGGAAPYTDFIGEYRDRYRRDGDGRWRFQERQLHSLSGPVSAPETGTGPLSD